VIQITSINYSIGSNFTAATHPNATQLLNFHPTFGRGSKTKTVASQHCVSVYLTSSANAHIMVQRDATPKPCIGLNHAIIADVAVSRQVHTIPHFDPLANNHIGTDVCIASNLGRGCNDRGRVLTRDVITCCFEQVRSSRKVQVGIGAYQRGTGIGQLIQPLSLHDYRCGS
jgi:hypothetical protein